MLHSFSSTPLQFIYNVFLDSNSVVDIYLNVKAVLECDPGLHTKVLIIN